VFNVAAQVLDNFPFELLDFKKDGLREAQARFSWVACSHLKILAATWGSQSWLQPPFRRRLLQVSRDVRRYRTTTFVMPHHERRLPHWDVVEETLFVTFRLHDSLPPNRVFPPCRLTTGKAFVAMDRILDGARSGPLFLHLPAIAKLIVDALHDGERRFHRYLLHSFVVMPNHVHLLVTPHVVTTKWLGPLKGFTAYRANRVLGRQGRPFWQDESYDRLVRSPTEFGRIRNYIEGNPVKAGLARAVEEYPWSSAISPDAA